MTVNLIIESRVDYFILNHCGMYFYSSNVNSLVHTPKLLNTKEGNMKWAFVHFYLSHNYY